MWPLTYPISLLLDRVVGCEIGTVVSRPYQNCLGWPSCPASLPGLYGKLEGQAP